MKQIVNEPPRTSSLSTADTYPCDRAPRSGGFRSSGVYRTRSHIRASPPDRRAQRSLASRSSSPSLSARRPERQEGSRRGCTGGGHMHGARHRASRTGCLTRRQSRRERGRAPSPALRSRAPGVLWRRNGRAARVGWSRADRGPCGISRSRRARSLQAASCRSTRTLGLGRCMRCE